MKISAPLATTCLAIGFAAAAFAQDFANSQPADVVIGQPNFTTNAPTTASASITDNPTDVFVDPATGKLFVCDEQHNRVLRFSSAAAAVNGAGAEAVFGQPDFVTATANTGGISATSMDDPLGIYVDSTGALWVADSDNNRVLRFDGATGPVTLATLTADQVIGQPDFVTAVGGTTAITLGNPLDVWVDASGNLWVADAFNNRVLRYDAVAGLGNGPAATRVFGQADAISGGAATTQTGMSNPFSVCVDASGILWVADQGNSRVLRFNGAAGVAVDGPAASGVLGQPGFITSAAGTTQSILSGPRGVNVNSAGRLWVSDYGNNRVLWFNNAAAKANGSPANGVLGQASFTTSTSGLTQGTFDNPVGLHQDTAGHLWVADSNNNRALRFSAATPDQVPLISLIGPTKRTTSNNKVNIKGLSGDPDGVVVAIQGKVNTGSYSVAKGISPWRYTARKLKIGNNRVKIRAVDNSGLVSTLLRVTVRRVP
jgi:sugar lactone lactonase YvrE